jgi:pilus assembly protein Flp/PilA
MDITEIRRLIRYLVRNEKGATAIEYGLLAGLIAVVLIGAVTLAGNALKDVFDTVKNALVPPTP